MGKLNHKKFIELFLAVKAANYSRDFETCIASNYNDIINKHLAINGDDDKAFFDKEIAKFIKANNIPVIRDDESKQLILKLDFNIAGTIINKYDVDTIDNMETFIKQIDQVNLVEEQGYTKTLVMNNQH